MRCIPLLPLNFYPGYSLPTADSCTYLATKLCQEEGALVARCYHNAANDRTPINHYSARNQVLLVTT